MSANKELRHFIVDNRDTTPRARHSLNQAALNRYMDAERRFFGNNRKAEKAERRRTHAEWYEREYLTTPSQFVRSLEAVLAGETTPEHIRYVLDHLEEFAKPLTPSERRLTGVDADVDISIFNLPRR